MSTVALPRRPYFIEGSDTYLRVAVTGVPYRSPKIATRGIAALISRRYLADPSASKSPDLCSSSFLVAGQRDRSSEASRSSRRAPDRRAEKEHPRRIPGLDLTAQNTGRRAIVFRPESSCGTDSVRNVTSYLRRRYMNSFIATHRPSERRNLASERGALVSTEHSEASRRRRCAELDDEVPAAGIKGPRTRLDVRPDGKHGDP